MATLQPPRKLALGLFHFNVQYVAGSLQGYHRYCTQAILPFLDVFRRNPGFRASFELCGSGLEFLAKHYPTALNDLRNLSSQGQLELISATYTPSLWVAFPRRDLVKSVELNRRRVEALGLIPARIFFSQEAFFGQGLRSLDGLFTAAVCKDEFVRHQIPAASDARFFSLGRMRVIVGAGHMVNDLAHLAATSPDSPLGRAGLGVYGRRIRRANALPPSISGPATEAASGRLSWHWYHLGSGHHFTTPHAPENAPDFFSDARWTSMNEWLLRDLQEKGHTLGTIGDFLAATRDEPTVPLPAVIESSWNTEKSRGVFTWMNRQERNWDRNSHILGLAWRSRHQLRKCEIVMEGLPAEAQNSFGPALEMVWLKQLIAESSDPCGWSPTPSEVRFGMDSAESALEAAHSLLLKLTARFGAAQTDAPPLDEIGIVESARHPVLPLDPAPALIGAEGSIEGYACAPDVTVFALDATAVGQEAGISFPLKSRKISFCPSALETAPCPLDLDQLLPEEIFLPLANGLIGLGGGYFLIRINRHGQPSVQIRKDRDTIVFSLSGAIAGRPLLWRFLLVSGTEERAVALANEINDV